MSPTTSAIVFGSNVAYTLSVTTVEACPRIEDGASAIRDYADGKDNDFQPKQGNSVAWGIIAEAFKYGLDPTDEKQRRMATAYLLEKVSWTGIAS